MANTASPVQIEKFLRDVDYPASKDEVIEAAEAHGADESVIDTLRRVPMDIFNSPSDVADGIGRIDEESV